jgi:hypothetical protein
VAVNRRVLTLPLYMNPLAKGGEYESGKAQAPDIFSPFSGSDGKRNVRLHDLGEPLVF